MSAQLDQGSKRLSQLEEEKKSAEQNLKRTQSMLDDFRGRLLVLFNLYLSRYSLI